MDRGLILFLIALTLGIILKFTLLHWGAGLVDPWTERPKRV